MFYPRSETKQCWTGISEDLPASEVLKIRLRTLDYGYTHPKSGQGHFEKLLFEDVMSTEDANFTCKQYEFIAVLQHEHHLFSISEFRPVGVFEQFRKKFFHFLLWMESQQGQN